MIRRSGPKGHLLITQNDHAMLARDIAAQWGNARFPAPRPRDPVLIAVECHDAGWFMQDDKPILNPARLPASFYEMPPVSYGRLWVASISAAAARGGPTAGLLVSWHFAALAQMLPAQENEAVQAMLADFAAAQLARRNDYCTALGLSPTMAGCPPRPSHRLDFEALYNLWVLRICDWLSLALCDNELPGFIAQPKPSPESAAVHLNTAWRDSSLLLDPWPLGVPQLQVNINGRRVPAGQYRRDSDLRRVYDEGRRDTLTITLAPAQPVSVTSGPETAPAEAPRLAEHRT